VAIALVVEHELAFVAAVREVAARVLRMPDGQPIAKLLRCHWHMSPPPGGSLPCGSAQGVRPGSFYRPMYEFTFNIIAKPLFIKVLCYFYNIEAKSLFGNRNFIDPLPAFTYSGGGWEKVG
jgi:hypothetical protein